MSYNINSSEYLSGGPLKISRGKAREILDEIGWDEGSGEIAECNFLDELDLNPKLDQDELLEIKSPWWSGEHSGGTYGVLQKRVLPHTKGTAIILFTWEGGDSRTALRVADGKVTVKKVKVTADE